MTHPPLYYYSLFSRLKFFVFFWRRRPACGLTVFVALLKTVMGLVFSLSFSFFSDRETQSQIFPRFSHSLLRATLMCPEVRAAGFGWCKSQCVLAVGFLCVFFLSHLCTLTHREHLLHCMSFVPLSSVFIA
jgi:ABC-type phosphate/phosphonate transport system permease subunit